MLKNIFQVGHHLIISHEKKKKNVSMLKNIFQVGHHVII